MKKIYTILVAVIAAISVISCKKDIQITEKPVKADGINFTASIDTKVSIADNGKVSWTAGDKIVILNGETGESKDGTKATNLYVRNEKVYTKTTFDENAELANGAAEIITITDDMISADGSLLSFTAHVNPSKTDYYVYVTDDLGVINYISNTGAFQGQPRRSIGAKVPHLASAKCSSTESTLSFGNCYTIFKFALDGNFNKVTLQANEGSTNKMVCVGWFSFGNAPTTGTDNSDVFTVNTGGNPGTYYAPVYPGTTLDKGFTFKLYSDATTVAKTLVVSASIKATRGKLINFGTLDLVPVPAKTYKEMYDAGEDIVIGGVTINKEKYPNSVVYSQDATIPNTVAGKVVFVEEGVTLTHSGWGTYLENTVFIGNKIGTRSTFKVASGAIAVAAADNQASVSCFANLNIEHAAEASQYMVNCNKRIGKVVFDNCSIKSARTDQFRLIKGFSATENITDLVVVNSDMEIGAGGATLIYGTSTVTAMNSIVLKNNVFYSSAFKEFYIGVNNTHKMTFNNIDIENNTYINVYNTTGTGFLYIEGATSAIVKGNLYTNAAANTTDKYQMSLRTVNSVTDITPNNANTDKRYPSAISYRQYINGSTWSTTSTALTSDPFEVGLSTAISTKNFKVNVAEGARR